MAPATFAGLGGYKTSTEEQLNVIATLGAESIGIWIANIVLGCNIVQYIRYFDNFRDDHWLMRSTVALLAVLDILGTVFYLRLLWFWTVLHWGNVTSLEVLDYSFFADIALTAIVPFIVQLYFVFRVYVVSGRRARVLPVGIAALGCFGMAWGLTTTGVVFGLGVPEKLHHFLYGVYLWFLSSAGADFLITTSMLWFITQAKSKTTFRTTRNILDRLIVLVFETNAVTLVGALGILILFATTSTKSYAYNALSYVVTKVYVLSLLIATNSRLTLRAENVANPSGGRNQEVTGVELGHPTASQQFSRSKLAPNPSGFAQNIKITNLTVIEDDGYQNEKYGIPGQPAQSVDTGRDYGDPYRKRSDPSIAY